MINFRLINLYHPFVFLIIILKINNSEGLNQTPLFKNWGTHLRKRDSDFFGKKPDDTIAELNRKDMADKENEELNYNDEYKDILFVFPNSSLSFLPNKTKGAFNKTGNADYDNYDEPESNTEYFRPIMRDIVVLKNTTSTHEENTTIYNRTHEMKTTRSPKDAYYDENDTDYFLDKFREKDYMTTVTIPTVIVISLLLVLIFLLLHLPKCCFGLFYEPPYESYYLKNLALAAKEDAVVDNILEEYSYK